MSNYALIRENDILNGDGLRTSIFFTGCEFACPNCFNSDIWSFEVGQHFSWEVYENKIKPTINEHISGISILGGEPFHPKNIKALEQLIYWFKEEFRDKTVWCWTGYLFEDLAQGKSYKDFWEENACLCTLRYIDVLVDGPFIEAQKDLTLKWRGSSNQRVIDVQKSLEKGQVILYCD